MPPKNPKKPDVPQVVLRLVYDGKTYDIPQDPNTVPWKIRLELTNQTQMTLAGMAGRVATGNVDTIFMMAWLFVCRRMNGETITFEQVADKWEDEMFESAEVVPVGDSPEA